MRAGHYAGLDMKRIQLAGMRRERRLLPPAVRCLGNGYLSFLNQVRRYLALMRGCPQDLPAYHYLVIAANSARGNRQGAWLYLAAYPGFSRDLAAFRWRDAFREPWGFWRWRATLCGYV